MNKPFTFAKSDDDNIPSDARNSNYWDEPDEDEEIINDDGDIEFVSNEDL